MFCNTLIIGSSIFGFIWGNINYAEYWAVNGSFIGGQLATICVGEWPSLLCPHDVTHWSRLAFNRLYNLRFTRFVRHLQKQLPNHMRVLCLRLDVTDPPRHHLVAGLLSSLSPQDLVLRLSVHRSRSSHFVTDRNAKHQKAWLRRSLTASMAAPIIS